MNCQILNRPVKKIQKPPVDPKDAWRLPTFQEIEEDLRETVKKKGINAVDPISIALKQNPMPLKDVSIDWLQNRTNA